MRLHAIWRLCVLSLLTMLLAAPALAQDQVRTHVSAGDDRGRIVFDWPSPVGYRAAIEGRNLVVRFDRPFRSDIAETAQRLDGYVENVILSGDGRVASFTLKGDYALKTSHDGGTVIIDLLPAVAAEPSGDATKPGGKPLGVRVGIHDGYSRLVFDWTRDVDYKVDRQGDSVSIRFDHSARIDLSALRERLPDRLTDVSLRNGANGMTIALRVPADARLRHFKVGPKVVLDVLFAADGAKTAAESGSSIRPTAGQEPQAQSPARLPPEPARVVPSGMPTRLVPRAAAVEPVAAGSSPPSPQATTRRTERTASSPAAPLPDATPPKPKPDPDPQSERQAQPAVSDAPALRAGPVVEPQLGNPEVSLVFEWPEPVGAAAFRRGDYVWIVFDRRTPLDLAPMRAAAKHVVTRMEQLPIGAGTVLRLRAEPGINPFVRREGTSWIVELRKQAIRPEVSVLPEVDTEAEDGPQLVLPVSEFGEIIKIPDPEVGDMMQVATLRAPGHGIRRDRRYPQFSILASAQGVAVLPLDDEIELKKTEKEGLVLATAGGLHVSAVPNEEKRKQAALLLGPRLFAPEEWARGKEPFMDAKQALQRTVVEVPAEKRDSARLDLARFYFARGLAFEALGILRVIERSNPALATQPDFMALRGATLMLAERPEEAAQDLLDVRLDKYPEAALWRGVLAVAAGDVRRAAEQFRIGDAVLRSYPYPLKAELGLKRIGAALSVVDAAGATVWLDLLEKEKQNLTRSQLAEVHYQQARIARSRRDIDRAVALWQNVKNSGDRFHGSRAEYMLIDLGLQQETIDADEAIERLERLRYAWRGGAFELKVLRRLGELYLAKNDYRNGLGVLRVAVTYFPENKATPEITKAMTDAFKRLYLEGAADELPPLTALALYDDFRELTPAGPDGDAMIQKLVDRLVNVDLLNRAAELLEHQVRFRLKGKEKARAGLKLAVIRLLDQNAEGAVAALRGSRATDLPPELEDDRRRVEAKAMFELGRNEDAVALLAGDISREADLLRADIYWRAEDWSETAKVLQRLAGAPPPAGATYGQEQAQIVLNWAVALRLNDDETGLALLRDLYGSAMSGSPLADSFRFIASASPSTADGPLSIARQAAEAEQFKAFLANYRERLIPKEAPKEASSTGKPIAKVASPSPAAPASTAAAPPAPIPAAAGSGTPAGYSASPASPPAVVPATGQGQPPGSPPSG